MPRFEWDVSIGAALLFPLLFYMDRNNYLAALLPAIVFHELGHCAAVWLCGGRMISLRLDTAGILLTATAMSPKAALISTLAGPCMGFLWAAAAYRLPGSFWQDSAHAALILNILNMLPALPLDGGQILMESGVERAVLRITTLTVAVLFVAVAVYLQSILPLLPVPPMLRAIIRPEESL